MAVLTAIGCVLFVSSLQALPNSHNLICLKNKQCIKIVRTAATSLSKFWKWQKNGFKTWAVKKQNVRMKTYLSRSLRAHQPGPLSRFSNGKTFYCKHKVLFATLFSNIGFFSLERTHSTEKSAIGGGGEEGKGAGMYKFHWNPTGKKLHAQHTDQQNTNEIQRGKKFKKAASVKAGWFS